MSLNPIRLKRVYEPADEADGKRLLVERLWPRGISKEKAALDFWFKELAPSTDLRKWYDHQLARWEGFQEKYQAELTQKPDLLAELFHLWQEAPITLVYAARDEHHNSAVVLKAFLENAKP